MAKLSKLLYWMRIGVKLGNRPLILSAGMPRSGSTLLFNVLREILSAKWGDQLSTGWDADILKLSRGKAYLVKVHNIDRFYRNRSQFMFYTFRDIRVTAVSEMKMFNNEPSIENFQARINQYLVAKKYCDLIFKYEDVLQIPENFVQSISNTLGIKVDVDAITQKTFKLKPQENIDGEYAKDTLLHKKHFTNTKDDEWRSLFSEDLKKEVNSRFSWWFQECGYPEA